MESKLYEAALTGSVPTLLELLQQDPLIIDRVGMNCLSESPLHVAALLGHVDFVKEIIRQKPELAGELDSNQSSALHIASQKGYVHMVKVLLKVNPAMCFARDLDGRNPLHLAAMTGRIDVLEELFRTRPLAASATMIWGETILHLCVKHNQLEALKFLLDSMDDPQLLNAKDDYGMTILHLAGVGKQIEVIKFLTTRTMIDVNALNANGFTALDVLAQSKRDIKDWEIGELLRRAGAISAKDMLLPANDLAISQTNGLITSHEKNQKHEHDWMEKKRNSIMVVASLIATMAFEAGVDPPSGPWKDTIMAFNTTGFLASLSIILLLISGLPLNRRLFTWILMVIMWVAITAMAMTYAFSIDFIEGSNLSYSTLVIFVWIAVWGVLVLGHSIRLMVRMIKRIRKSIRRPGHIQAQDGHDHEPPIASIL